MKLKHLIPLLFCSSLAFAEGPVFQHKDTFVQQEFENIYQDIRTVLGLSGSARCIDDPTFCVDTVSNDITQRSETTNIFYNQFTNTASFGAFLIQQDETNLGGLVGYGSTHSSVADEVALKNYNVAGNLGLYIGSGRVVNIDSSGAIVQPYQPAFSYEGDAETDVTGDQTDHIVQFKTKIFDKNNDFNAGTYSFTAPVTGTYLFIAQVAFGQVDGTHESMKVTIDTSNRDYSDQRAVETPNLSTPRIAVPAFADMDANDTAKVKAFVGLGDKVVDISATNCYFKGSLIN